VHRKPVRRLGSERGPRPPTRLRTPKTLGPKPGASRHRGGAPRSRSQNDVSTGDFIPDRTADGRTLPWRTRVDESTSECLALHAAASRTGTEVRRTLARVLGRRGAPTRIRSDNGSEFLRETRTGGLRGKGSEPIPVAAGRPCENGSLESFQSRPRDEFLEREEFESVADAWAQGTWFRREDNAVRPHSSLGYQTPREFSAACDREVDGIKKPLLNTGSILGEDFHSRRTENRGADHGSGSGC
jgi:putative transposase